MNYINKSFPLAAGPVAGPGGRAVPLQAGRLCGRGQQLLTSKATAIPRFSPCPVEEGP
jgi:hypothetical protein